MRRLLSLSTLALVLVLLFVGSGPASARPAPAASARPQAPVGTGFTFQGQLKNAGAAVTGACDMTFTLFDTGSAGNPIGSPIAASVPVTNGLFTVALNSGGEFGEAAFNGDARWIEVAVKCAGDAAFTTLSPRQQINAAPYAQYAVHSTPATVAVQSTWIQQSPRNPPPATFSPLASGYDASHDRFVFLDAGVSFPRLTDIWVLENASGLAGTAGWSKLAPAGGPPTGRVATSGIYDPVSNRLIIYGGCQGNCLPTLSDAWVLSNANGLGGTPTWMQLPDAPMAREGNSAVYDSGSNRLIIFGGGEGWPGSSHNDVWVLVDANGIGSPGWVQLSPSGAAPAPRSGAGAFYDPATNRMVIFGGVHMLTTVPSYTFLSYNDVWILTNANGLGGTPEWIQITPAGSPPSARSGFSLSYDPVSNRMTIFGGLFQSDGPTPGYTYYNDAWVLTNANGVTGTPQWLELAPTGTLPEVRVSSQAAYSTSSSRMIMAAGYLGISGRYANDVWLLTNANGLVR